MSGRNWKIREVPHVVFRHQGVRVVAVFQHDVECPVWNGWTLGEDQWKEADAFCRYYSLERDRGGAGILQGARE